jgi:hypothetical protein
MSEELNAPLNLYVMDFVNVNVKQDWGKKTLIDDGVTCLMILL